MLRIATLLLLLSCTAQAAELDETITAKLRLADKQLPLPRGEWIVAGLGTQHLPHDAAGPFGAIRTAVLLQRNGDAVTAIAEFNTNDISLSDGWRADTACDGAPPELRLLRYSSRLDFACAFVTDTHPTGGPLAWQQALGFIKRHHLHVPDTMLTAAFIVCDRQDFVDARLHFDPAGFPPHDKAQRVLLAWAKQFAPAFDAGMSNQLDDTPRDGPLRAALLSDTPELDQRLLAIEALQHAGTLTAVGAVAQQQAALADQPRSAEGAVISVNGWYYRVTTPLINLVTAYTVTQSGPLSIAIALTEQFAHSLVFAANRAGWDRAVRQALRHRVPAPVLLHIGEAGSKARATS